MQQECRDPFAKASAQATAFVSSLCGVAPVMRLRERANPSILLFATLRWPILSRLAIAFSTLGCTVEAVCPRGHPETRSVRRFHLYSGLRSSVSLRAAIALADPNLIVPCDDNAAMQLRALYKLLQKSPEDDVAMQELLRESLGDPDACVMATRRNCLIDLADQENIRIPATAPIENEEEMVSWIAQHRLPAVLKIDSTWGGQGVVIVQDLREAKWQFRRIQARPALHAVLARLLLDRDWLPLRQWLAPVQRRVTIQEFIVGRPANRAVACWKGQVLAGTSVAAIHTQSTTGPATVVRVIDYQEMTNTAQSIVRRLGVSGFWGLDFVIDEATGAAYLIEMNPRATPISHLSLGTEGDLPAALVDRWTGGKGTRRASINQALIALFPGELKRDPQSVQLRRAFHDVPWHEPAVVRDGIDRPWAERGLIARCWAKIKRLSRRWKNAPCDASVGAHDNATCTHPSAKWNGLRD